MDLEQTTAKFETTEWTLLEALHCDQSAQRVHAKEVLVSRYWPATYAWLRRRGNDPEKAAELTQAFFCEVVLSRNLMERADKDRGKLRTYFLKALRQFSTDKHRRAVARKSDMTISISDLALEEQSLVAISDVSPDEAFHTRWVLGVVNEAIARCERYYKRSNHPEYWKAFEARILQPAMSGSRPAELSDIAIELDFPSPQHAATAVFTVKARCRSMLKQLAGESFDPDVDEKHQLRDLIGLLT